MFFIGITSTVYYFFSNVLMSPFLSNFLCIKCCVHSSCKFSCLFQNCHFSHSLVMQCML